MKVIMCDHCGQIFNKVAIGKSEVTVNKRSPSDIDVQYFRDLCPECTEELLNEFFKDAPQK